MTPKNLKFTFFFLFFLTFILNPGLVLAQNLEIQYPSIPFTEIETPNEFMLKIEAGEYPLGQALPLYIKYFYHLSLAIAALVAFGTMLLGGVQYMLSFGAVVKMIIAREQILGGVLGLIILFSSYLILVTINPQLTVFNISGLEKVEIEPVEIEEVEPRTPTYFQIPTGIIIENAVLNQKAQEKLDYAFQAAEITAESAQELYNLSEETYNLVEETYCGHSKCNQNCSPTGCDGKDNQDKIEETAEKTPLVIADLEEKKEELMMAKIPLIEDLSQLEAAAFLMSEYQDVFTYNDLISLKHYYEIVKKDVEVDSFSGWENIDIKVNDRITKDPVTFYLDKERNEDVIYLASTLPTSFYQEIDLLKPEEGWPAPPEGVPNVPLYKQTDPRWANKDYGCGTTIYAAGCGPTSLAMILSYYTGRMILPDEIATLSLRYGHRVCGHGTAPTLFSDTRILHGLKGLYRTNNSMSAWTEVLERLNHGPVIISVGPSMFTGGTHYIVLKAKIGNIIYINDSFRAIYQAPEDIVRSAFLRGSGNYAWFGY